MTEEDVARYLEWELADGEEVANEVCGVQCLACGDLVIVEPGTHDPVAQQSRVERIESMDDAEPHEVRIYCSDECRDDDLLQTDGGRMSDPEQCGYCDEPREAHPVHDDHGGLACSGMEVWYA